ncbi:MAG: chorismate synthase [Bacteroidales bacterium]|jgi:chorismate synthase|nr:chorismate synthase [Bacteroidales bacterium]
MSNTIGHIFRLTSFGESHGEAVGGVIDGCPSGLLLDVAEVQRELDRRRPGQSDLTTARNEADQVRFLSGLMDGYTTGTPLAFVVNNNNQHSKDYSDIKDLFRPSHADYTYQTKYGIRDHRGGGRTSARETISRVVAGAVAKQVLSQMGVRVYAYTSQVGGIALDKDYKKYSPEKIETNAVRCPDEAKAEEMAALIREVKADGDTIGGVITCVATGVPAGWGEPVFDKLHAALGSAVLSINACKGFEYGSGFDVDSRGSIVNDVFVVKDGKVTTKTNNSGGIQGGISNGQDIYFRAAFKPVATVLKQQDTINKDFQETKITVHGRHDPCVLPRAVPVVEAMTAITLLDFYLLSKSINRNS